MSAKKKSISYRTASEQELHDKLDAISLQLEDVIKMRDGVNALRLAVGAMHDSVNRIEKGMAARTVLSVEEEASVIEVRKDVTIAEQVCRAHRTTLEAMRAWDRRQKTVDKRAAVAASLKARGWGAVRIGAVLHRDHGAIINLLARYS